jgi:hypothetical protein
MRSGIIDKKERTKKRGDLTMDQGLFPHLGRRDFMKYALLTAGVLSMPMVPGCGISKKNVPDLD